MEILLNKEKEYRSSGYKFEDCDDPSSLYFWLQNYENKNGIQFRNDDIFYNIIKYLGKIGTILSKTLRSRLLNNLGVSIKAADLHIFKTGFPNFAIENYVREIYVSNHDLEIIDM